MGNSVLKIRCPNDGAILMIRDVPNLDRAVITCPVCKQKIPFKKFKVIVDAPQGATEYPTSHRSSVDDNDTEYPTHIIVKSNETELLGNYEKIGVIRDASGSTYKLRLGENIIGRESLLSKADIQLLCPKGSKRMSREHLLIKVERDGTGRYIHYVSLYKEEVNITKIGEVKFKYGDRIILNDGNEISLPDVNIRFEIPK